MPQEPIAEIKSRFSVTFKIFFVGVLILILLIPMASIQSLIWERKSRRDAAAAEVTDTWGGSQTVAPPVLILPYLKKFYTEEMVGQKKVRKMTSVEKRDLYFVPEKWSVTGEIKPEIRYRGQYEVLLYKTDLAVSGNFASFDVAQILPDIPAEDVLWQEASLSVEFSDLRTLADDVKVRLGETALPLEEGKPAVLPEALQSALTLDEIRELAKGGGEFSYNLKLSGSENISVLPIGKTVGVKLKSDWPNPQFLGNRLPDSRSVGENGFESEWRVVRYRPTYLTDDDLDVNVQRRQSFGVKLIFPVDVYQIAMRSAKYASLFIVLTFAAFFLFEVLNRLRVHPIQYLLVGFAMCQFYLLLLAISEYAHFDLAYAVAAFSTIALISLYSRFVLGGIKKAGIIGALITGIYAYLYVVLQAEDSSLLLGSVGLFAMLAAVMFLTRKVDWYALSKA